MKMEEDEREVRRGVGVPILAEGIGQGICVERKGRNGAA